MTIEGANLELIFNGFQAVHPAITLLTGVAIGMAGTIAFRRWHPHIAGKFFADKGAKSDPLSKLFDAEVLNNQLARVADETARSERVDREISAIRAKIFAHTSARKAPNNATTSQHAAPSHVFPAHMDPAHMDPAQAVPPHKAERFDHAEVLAHIAKVMRAGSEIVGDSDDSPREASHETNGDFEEVLLLPSPTSPPASSKAA